MISCSSLGWTAVTCVPRTIRDVGPRRGQVHHSVAVVEIQIDIDAPSQADVEALGAVVVGDGDDDDLEPESDTGARVEVVSLWWLT